MKLEHKIGIAVTCAFLCLTGAVIGLKMQDQPAPEVKNQVASEGKDNDPTQGARKNMFVPGMGGNEPSETLSPSDGRRTEPKAGPKNQKDPAAAKDPEKPEASASPPRNLLSSDSGNRSLVQTPPAPVDPATDPSRKKDNPLDVQGFDVPNSESAAEATKQPKAQERVSKPVAPEPEKKRVSPEGPVMIGIGEQSTSSQGKKETTSTEKEKKQDPTTLNNKPKEQPLPKNDSPASFLTGGSPTGGTSKPTTPPPATPPTRSIIPVGGAFEGSQTASPPSSGVSSLEKDKGTPPIPPSSSTNRRTDPTPMIGSNWNLDSENASDKKDSASGQGNSSPTSPSKLSDLKTGDGKSAPSLMPSGEKGNEDRFTGSPPPAPPSPMMDKLPDNKAVPAPAPAAPPTKPADNSYFVPDSYSTTGSGANSTAGSGGRSAAAPPGLLPYPEPPGSPPPPSSPSGTERVKPLATEGAATAPKAIARPQPQVIVYDEQEYRAAAGDTFEKISTKYYGTDKFAEALRRHNRHHARASLQMTNEGTLVPGERLYIPPADILEQRYGDTIVKPSSSQATPASYNSPIAPSGK